MSVCIFRLGFASKILSVLLMFSFPVAIVAAAENEGEESFVLIEKGDVAITQFEAQRMLNHIPPAHRAYLIEDPENLHLFLLAKMTQKLMTTEAVNLGIMQQDRIEWELEEARRTLLARSLIERREAETIFPSNLEVLAEEYYLSHSDEFLEGTFIELAHILIRTDAEMDAETAAEKKALIEGVLAEVQAGLPFDEAAKKYGEDATAELGGSLGVVTRGQMVPPFEAAGFALVEEGDISEVIQTDFGYHIIKLLTKTQAGTVRPYAEVEEELLLKGKTQYLTLVLNQYAETFQSNESKVLYVPAMDRLFESLKEQVEIEAEDVNEAAD